jgi:hypothetical protein
MKLTRGSQAHTSLRKGCEGMIEDNGEDRNALKGIAPFQRTIVCLAWTAGLVCSMRGRRWRARRSRTRESK